MVIKLVNYHIQGNNILQAVDLVTIRLYMLIHRIRREAGEYVTHLCRLVSLYYDQVSVPGCPVLNTMIWRLRSDVGSFCKCLTIAI